MMSSPYFMPPHTSPQLSGSAARKVTQFHFTGWPDHGVPEYATSLLAFHRKVKSQHDGSKGPILAHCRWVEGGGKVEGCHGVVLTPQCWCGTYGNSDCYRHSAGANREGGAGGHSWYHQEDETTEDEDGPDTCKPHSCSLSHPH